MNLVTILLLQTILGGIAGVFVNLHVAAFRLSSESVNSPHFGLRWLYRYFIFSLCYLASFLFTPALIVPLFGTFEAIQSEGARTYGYFVLCLPLASLLFYADYRLIKWGDARKLRGREALAKKYGEGLGR